MAGMFSSIAARYDIMNDLASVGQDRWWRSHLVDALAPQPGEVILDLAAGTGASAAPIARSGAKVIATDLTEDMVRLGQSRHPHIPFVIADGLRLPYADGAFDAATISFGLRNVPDPELALRELLRVVRPGGTLVVCEFSTPTSAPTRLVHRQWLGHAIPFLTKVTSSDAMAYSYLCDSIMAWPDQHGLAAMLETAGWQDVQWRNLTGGIVALHRASRP